MAKAADQSKKPKQDTPAMRQYRRFKEQHPDCILFFRMGDFYEMFYDDAVLAHKVLGVTLTQRTQGVPMAGVPYHAAETYLRRMIQAGYRVAVCEQMESPTEAKGVVRRDVTRVVTPGTLTDETLLEDGQENLLAAVMFHSDQEASAAWAELSTGDFAVTTMSVDDLADELSRLRPRELLYVETATGEAPQRVRDIAEATKALLTSRPAWHFRIDEAVETIRKQYQVGSLRGFGFDEGDVALGPAAAVIRYLLETQKTAQAPGDVKSLSGNTPSAALAADRLAHLQPPRRYRRDDHLVIDPISLRSLEIESTLRGGEARGSLLHTLQNCVTAMGKRRMRQWLCYPLAERGAIEARQRVVAAAVEDGKWRDAMRALLDDVHDVQRIVARISVGRATPRDLVALGQSSACAARLAALLDARPAAAGYHERVATLAERLDLLATKITKACVDEPPAHMREGNLFRDGFDAALDEQRLLQRDNSEWLAQYQQQLATETGISSLKVGYNRVFGFYIEITVAHRDKAPAAWTRRQTLKNAERYITAELKEREDQVLGAESRAVSREQELFGGLCEDAAGEVPALQQFTDAVADLDVLMGFADRAVRRRYVQPTMVDEPIMHVIAGRHPVLDELLDDQFVPNDITLGVSADEKEAAAGKAASLGLITGPNMAGKSTYIRQTALLALMAHAGAFVPAERATIGMCDRIFTRVGANDELHAGQSTFMVEMTETANICNHATDRSLVILDEIGRGTSTLDGLSLAWALAEFIARRRARCLFATHYHEITQLADELDNVTNLSVTVREWNDQIVFLHRIAPGAANRSYGIHVARLAGIPASVVRRANALLEELQVSHATTAPPRTPAVKAQQQMSLFTEYVSHPIIDAMRDTDMDHMSPLEAFDLLRQWRKQLDSDAELDA